VREWYHPTQRVRQGKKRERVGRAALNRPIYILIFTVALVAVPTAAVAKPSPQEQPSQTASQDDNSRTEQPNTPGVAGPKSKQDIPIKAPPANEGNKSDPESARKPDWWSRIPNGITAIATLALAVIGAVAAGAAIRTLQAIERQTGELQESVSVARTNAAAAKASADALIASERAWVNVELIPVCCHFGKAGWHRPVGNKWASLSIEEVLKGEHMRYTVKITNMGRTLAEVYNYEIRWGALVEGKQFSPQGLPLLQTVTLNEFIAQGDDRRPQEFNAWDAFTGIAGKGGVCITVNYGDIVTVSDSTLRPERISSVIYHYSPDATYVLQRVADQARYN
jgi:hypothetical protein